MTRPPVEELHALADRVKRRDRLLARLSFVSVLAAAGLVAVLTWLGASKAADVATAEARLKDTSSKLEQRQKALASVENDLAQKQVALGAIRAARTRHATVQYYRSSEKDLVEGALQDLGFRVVKGEATALRMPANAIAYSADVDPDEVQLVAYALQKSGLTIRRVAQAQRVQAPGLIQIYASAEAASEPPVPASDLAGPAARRPASRSHTRPPARRSY